jgi:hypothetical protein
LFHLSAKRFKKPILLAGKGKRRSLPDVLRSSEISAKYAARKIVVNVSIARKQNYIAKRVKHDLLSILLF